MQPIREVIQKLNNIQNNIVRIYERVQLVESSLYRMGKRQDNLEQKLELHIKDVSGSGVHEA